MRQWVEKAQQGDTEAFGQLMLHFRGMAYAVSYDMLKDVHFAEDAVQDAFMEAYQNLGKLQEPSACFSRLVQDHCHKTMPADAAA
ncbi:RNA polymerase sigma factor [Paenibacillus albidus]|uniref:RNA polymerase sigma factor n=1 Tax=Paenibacillus albidus TaxID=2041023 RepID=UPI00288A5475|nr:sigma factor [Paenibacillus albidus]